MILSSKCLQYLRGRRSFTTPKEIKWPISDLPGQKNLILIFEYWQILIENEDDQPKKTVTNPKFGFGNHSILDQMKCTYNCFSYSFYYVDLNSSNLYLKIRLENEDTPKLIWFGAIIGFYWVSCILCSLYCAAVCRRSERCHMGVVSLWSQIYVFSTISQNI